MDNDIVSRIKEIMTYHSLNSLALSKKLGYSSSEKISRLFRNTDAKPSFDIIYDISKFFEIDANWLVTGNGSMFREKENTSKGSLFSLSSFENEKDLLTIPVTEIDAAAGDGAFNGDYIEEVDTIKMPLSMVRKNTRYLCLRIKGRSMEPTLQHDGFVIVRMLAPSEWRDIKDGYIYVVSDREGQTRVKRIKNRLVERGFIVCTSDNPDRMAYASYNLREDELNTIWYVEWYLSARMPNIQETYYYKQSELEDKYEDLSHQVEIIKRALNVPNIQ